MANLRKITGTLRKALNGEPWGGARVNIRLLTDPATQAGEVFPTLAVTFHTAVDGTVPDGVFVATPDTDAWRYRVTIHGNTPFEVYLEGTGDISLDELISLANLPGQEPGNPVSDWTVYLYGQAQLADPFDVPTPAGEWRPLGTAAEAEVGDFDPAGSAATVQGNLDDHTGDSTTHFTQAAISITPSQAGADAAGSAAAAAAASIPLIAPAVAGNLPVITEEGTLVNSGYTAGTPPIPNTYALRSTNGELLAQRFQVANLFTTVAELDASGVLRFYGINAGTARSAQRTELGLGTAATQNSTAFDSAGSAAGVQSNLEGHTGLTTAAHGGIVASTDPRLTDARTPTAHAASHATAGSDPISPASIGAEVAGTTATHAGLTGTAVHGLGTMSTQSASSVAITGGTINGTTIGATTRAAGNFEALSSRGVVSLGSASIAGLIQIQEGFVLLPITMLGVKIESRTASGQALSLSGVTGQTADILVIRNTAASNPTIGFSPADNGLRWYNIATGAAEWTISRIDQHRAAFVARQTTTATGQSMSVALRAESSTTANQAVGRFVADWLDPTHATRTGRLTTYASDSVAERVLWQGVADGAAARLAFLGATPVIRQSVTGATTQLQVDSIVQALVAFGLVTDDR